MKKIITKKNSKELSYLRDKIVVWAEEYLKKKITSLDRLHEYIEKEDINQFRLYLFKQLNTKCDWKKLLLALAGGEIKELIGPDICVQKKINLSIIIPNDATSQLGVHSDAWSAESPFQLNLWIPITDAFGTNSMYLIDKERTLEVTKSINSEHFFTMPNDFSENKNFLNIKFGDILIFNPCLLHGNTINTTNSTRIALHIRFKNVFSPEIKEFPDRNTGTFYEVLELSENTKFALEYVKSAKGEIKAGQI
jgi:sporadic carbohydrate cluster 2OG-Fe(II) oxygenase